ncbi:MAG TPA: hypothetical protein VF819_09350 [Nitrospira sp.]
MADRLNAATKYIATHRPEGLEWGPFAAVGGVLDHAVQRDVFDEFELSHLSLRVLGCQHSGLDIK